MTNLILAVGLIGQTFDCSDGFVPWARLRTLQIYFDRGEPWAAVGTFDGAFDFHGVSPTGPFAWGAERCAVRTTFTLWLALPGVDEATGRAKTTILFILGPWP